MDKIVWYSLAILPLIVFCARVVDVSLGPCALSLDRVENGGSPHCLDLFKFLTGSLLLARSSNEFPSLSLPIGL